MADLKIDSLEDEKLVLSPIGVVRSPHRQAKGAPIQSSGAKGVKGTVEVHPIYEEGLKDVEGFSHLVLLYHCHLCKGYKLTVRPFLDNADHGLFAIAGRRSPSDR